MGEKSSLKHKWMFSCPYSKLEHIQWVHGACSNKISDCSFNKCKVTNSCIAIFDSGTESDFLCSNSFEHLSLRQAVCSLGVQDRERPNERYKEKNSKEENTENKQRTGQIPPVICRWYVLKPAGEASVSWAITKHVRIIISLKIWLEAHHAVPCTLLSWGIHSPLLASFSLSCKRWL